MGDLLWMWNDRDSTHSAAFGWGPVRGNFVKSVLLSWSASHGIIAGCRGNINTRFSDHSSRRNETPFVTHERKGGDEMERRHFLKLAFGYVAGAAALAASAKAAPLAPISAEHSLVPPRGEGAEPAVTTQDDADRLKPEEVRWGRGYHRGWHRGRHWGWRRRHWGWRRRRHYGWRRRHWGWHRRRWHRRRYWRRRYW
jgi:hypothetical protein